MVAIREEAAAGLSRRGILPGALVLNLGFALTANLIAFRAPVLQSLGQSTSGWLGPTVVVNAVGLALVVLGWLMFVGRVPPRSLGFRTSNLGRALWICVATWAGIQCLAVVGLAVTGQPLAIDAAAFGATLPILFGQLAGNALYEETFYRGYLIPALKPEVGGRDWVAVFVAAAVFGLMHVTNYWVRGLSFGFLLPATAAGVLFGFLYLRTSNLWLCIGLHSLLNAPAALWDSPIPAFTAPTVALFVCLGLGPRINAGLVRSLDEVTGD